MEALVAAALAAGPLLFAFHLVQENAAGARFNHERAVERLILLDLAEILVGEPVADLRTLPDHPEEVSKGFAKRLSAMPEAVRERYRHEVAPYVDRIRARFEEDLEPAAGGLARITLTLPVDGSPGLEVSVRRLFRPAARLLAREIPEKN